MGVVTVHYATPHVVLARESPRDELTPLLRANELTRLPTQGRHSSCTVPVTVGPVGR